MCVTRDSGVLRLKKRWKSVFGFSATPLLRLTSVDPVLARSVETRTLHVTGDWGLDIYRRTGITEAE